MTAGAPVSVGTFLVIQFTSEAAENFKEALDGGGLLDFLEVDQDSIKVVAEFDGIGQGVIV